MNKQLSWSITVLFLCCSSLTLNAEIPSKIIRLNEAMKQIGTEKSCRGISGCLNEIKNSLTINNTAYVLIKPTKELCTLFLKSANYSKSTKTTDYMVFAADENSNWIGSSEKGCTNLDNCMPALCERMKFPKATWAGIFDAAHKR